MHNPSSLSAAKSALSHHIIIAIITALLSCAAFASPAKPAWEVQSQPAKIVNGSPLFFRVKAPLSVTALAGTWLEHDLSFSKDKSAREWYALAGTSIETHPGEYNLHLTGQTASGATLEFERQVRIQKAKYKKVSITVDTKFTQPNQAEVQQIVADKSLKHEVFARKISDRQWDGSFEAPVKATVSGVFGTARVVNGKTTSVHEGLDYAVPTGTPVAALNAGTVILAQPLYFEGNCVMLDHGQGLMTLYLHLSKIEVKEGQQISRGDQIGLSGGTGRSTGPHLHVAVRWQGVYLDPATLLEMKLP